MEILIGRPVDFHRVGILDLKSVARFQSAATRGVEYIIPFRVANIIGIVASVVRVLLGVAVRICCHLDRYRISGEILAVLRNDHSVHDAHGNRIIINFLIRHRCESHAVLSVLVYEKIDTVFRLFARLEIHFAGSAGSVGSLGFGRIEMNVDRLDCIRGESGAF